MWRNNDYLLSDSWLELLHWEAWQCHSKDSHHPCYHARGKDNQLLIFLVWYIAILLYTKCPCRFQILFLAWPTLTGSGRDCMRRTMSVNRRESMNSLHQRCESLWNRFVMQYILYFHTVLYYLCILWFASHSLFQNFDTENVDPELQTADESKTKSNKRHHDDVTTSPDLEDICSQQRKRPPSSTPTVTKHTLTSSWLGKRRESWKDVLGPPPPMGTTNVSPVALHHQYNDVIIASLL